MHKKKKFKAKIRIQINGIIETSEFNGHFMDKIEEILTKVKDNKTISISINDDFGEK